MSLLGEFRYGVTQAPGGLALVQELLNTASSGSPRSSDLLGDGAIASRWLGDLEISSAAEPLLDSELRSLRALRSSLVASVSGVRGPSVQAKLRLSINASGGVQAAEVGRIVSRLTSTVMLEVLLAQRTGEWRRLKICRNPDCNVGFFDRSKNGSGVWHDVHACGNAINLKASRSRRREASRSNS